MGQGIVEFLADGIIHLETYFDENNTLRRRLRILKMRGTNHAKIPYEYDITENGFEILEETKPKRRRRKTTTKSTRSRKKSTSKSSSKSKSTRTKTRRKTEKSA